MNTIAIDTYKTIQKLMKKGFTKEQAEVLVETLTETSGDVVTKTYLDSKVKDLEGSIKDTELRLYKALLVHGLAIVATILTMSKII